MTPKTFIPGAKAEKSFQHSITFSLLSYSSMCQIWLHRREMIVTEDENQLPSLFPFSQTQHRFIKYHLILPLIYHCDKARYHHHILLWRGEKDEGKGGWKDAETATQQRTLHWRWLSAIAFISHLILISMTSCAMPSRVVYWYFVAWS